MIFTIPNLWNQCSSFCDHLWFPCPLVVCSDEKEEEEYEKEEVGEDGEIILVSGDKVSGPWNKSGAAPPPPAAVVGELTYLHVTQINWGPNVWTTRKLENLVILEIIRRLGDLETQEVMTCKMKKTLICWLLCTKGQTFLSFIPPIEAQIQMTLGWILSTPLRPVIVIVGCASSFQQL